MIYRVQPKTDETTSAFQLAIAIDPARVSRGNERLNPRDESRF
jgi:hypothetical protein